jgi:NAD(P)-dependent dehydrogenase (short-subunit alcohol dehydrogenase family)
MGISAGAEPHVSPDMFRLDGRVALVTGASSGIGRRCARVLSAFGAAVTLAARRTERLETLARELSNAYPIACDLADPVLAATAVDVSIDKFGRLDIVVNAGGISEVVPATEELPKNFNRILTVNLLAPFVIAQRAAQAMVGSGTAGSIINISSIFGLVGVGQMPQAAYAASKGGLMNLTRELAAQWARKQIRVNAVSPGWFPTELTKDLFDSADGMRWLRGKTPMGRGGELRELDGAILLLASDAGSFITGQTITVDGGWTIV